MIEVRQLLARHFNLTEIKTLCFDLGVDFDELEGGTQKTVKIRELILYLKRQNRLDQLQPVLESHRPQVEWPEITSPVETKAVPVKLLSQQETENDLAQLTRWQRLAQLLRTWSTKIVVGFALITLILFILVLNGRLTPNSNWKPIKGGVAILGEPDKFCHIPVSPIKIQKTEVTNEDYLKCVQADKCSVPPTWVISEEGWIFPDGQAKHPVFGISWDDADEYCRLIDARLPTEAEWVRAARNDTTYNYPWGDEFIASKTNLYESSNGYTKEVMDNQLRCDDTGLCDVIGNVREWVSDTAVNPCDANFGTGDHISKGGSFSDSATYTTIWYRFQSNDAPYTGVRCVKSK